MSREIKYRGIVDGSMWHASPESDRWQQFWVLVDKETVGQYTGLKDSNRKDIYEGDILRVRVSGNGQSSMANREVKYRMSCGYYLYPFKENAYSYSPKFDEYLKAEVIGNIHTDPEPLRPKTAKS